MLTRGQAGSLVGWGENDYGQLGDGTTKTQQLFPENLIIGVEVYQISGGYRFSAAIIGNIQFFRLDLSDIFVEKKEMGVLLRVVTLETKSEIVVMLNRILRYRFMDYSISLKFLQDILILSHY